jgi:hypothetical protein
MKHKQLRFGEGFRVPLGNRRSQVAEMVIPPGDAEGDVRNRHRGADQWLLIPMAATNCPQRNRVKASRLIASTNLC